MHNQGKKTSIGNSGKNRPKASVGDLYDRAELTLGTT